MNGKTLQTSKETRKAIIALRSRGLSTAEVARRLGVSNQTVWTWVRRYRSTASVKDFPRAGRPRGTTSEQDRVIAEAIKADPLTTAIDIQRQYHLPCSLQTIRNRMQALRRGSHTPTKTPLAKDTPSGVLPEAVPLSQPVASNLLLPPSLSPSSIPSHPTANCHLQDPRKFSSDVEISSSPNSSSSMPLLSSTSSSSMSSSCVQEEEKQDAPALSSDTNRSANENAYVKQEPTWEERPGWETVWIKKEEEANEFKVEVKDETMEEEEDSDVTSTTAHGSSSGSGWVVGSTSGHTSNPSTGKRSEPASLSPPGGNLLQQKLLPIDSKQHVLGDTLHQLVLPPSSRSEKERLSSISPKVILSDAEEKNSSIIIDSEGESSILLSDSEESVDWEELNSEEDEAFPDRDIFMDSDSSSVESEDEEAVAGKNSTASPSEKITEVSWNWESGDFIPSLLPFDSSACGISPDIGVTEESSELDCFMYFFDMTLMNLIKRETNKQYQFTKKQNLWYLAGWQDVTVSELYLFLGLCMLMPHTSNGDKSDIWSSIPGVHPPINSKIMSGARYRMIAKMLHFSSNYVSTKDPLAKIRPVYSHLKKKFKEVLCPFRNLVIEESQILFKNRLAFRQSIPSKNHEYEVKTYVLCDCKSGFVMDFLIYSSAATEGATWDPHGTTGAIVKRLLEPLYGRGHTLFVSSWCTTPQLFHYLLTKKVGACGLVKPDQRSCPQFDSVSRGKSLRCHANKILAVKWHDRKNEHLLSTVHGWDTRNKSKPQPFVDYNNNTKRFGLSDTQISFAEVKVVKWYKKLFYHLVDLTILNAFTLYVMKTGTRPMYRAFHRRIIRQIFERFGGELVRRKQKRSKTEKNMPLRFLLSKGHFARLLSEKEDEKETQKSCYVCANTIRRPQKHKATCYYCSVCSVSLCVVPCFEKYHTLKEF